MHGFFLAYISVCFTVGIACSGLILVHARRTDDAVARAFLVFYAFFSVMVVAALLRNVVAVLPGPVNANQLFAIEYVESIVGTYGIMFSLPFFAHRAFTVNSRRRDTILVIVVLSAAVGQHFTEFWLPHEWDDRGDFAENLLVAALVTYTMWLGFSRLKVRGVDRPLAIRFLALLTFGLPGIFFDLFLTEDTPLRLYPLWYCLVSIVMTLGLTRRHPAMQTTTIPDDWRLSDRETEVVGLVCQGLSNKDIAGRLFISPNTVKTHLRAAFDKSGIRSRYGLISTLKRPSGDEVEPEEKGDS